MVGGVELRCLRLAARQHGVLTRRQARELGLSDRSISRRISSGRWRCCFASVYRIEGAPRTWRQDLRAALLWAGRSAAISHHAAAALLGFPRAPADALELTVSHHLDSIPPLLVHWCLPFDRRELTWVDGITVTSPTRTLVDLAAVDPPSTLTAAVDHALCRRWTTLDRLEVALERAGKRHGVATLRDIVNLRLGGEAPAESELESRVAELLESAGFPRPVRQRTVRLRGRVRRMDFLIPGTRVVIEADGYAFHSSLGTFEDQRARHRELASHGYVIVPWTWTALRDEPRVLVDQLRRTLDEANRPH